MPVRAFDSYLFERKLLQFHPWSLLKDSKIGIDASHYFAKAMAAHKEPLLSAIGGVPLSFKKTLEEDVKALREAQITPLFVFAGTSGARKDGPFLDEDVRVQRKLAAWDAYDQGKEDQAIAMFADMAPNLNENIKWFQSILHDAQVEFMVAPFSAWAQLAYLEMNQHIDAIYGPSEVLLFDVSKLIVDMNTQSHTFGWTIKRAILQDIGGMSDDQFLDICIIAGFELCSTFPPIDNTALNNGTFSFRAATDVLKNFRTGMNVVTSFAENPQVKQMDYVDRFKRAKFAIRHHVIASEDGKLFPLNRTTAPNDIHDFLSQRLPDEVYFYLMRGFIGPQVLSTLTSGILAQTASIDGGQSPVYQRFVEGLLDMRTQALNLLTQPLNRYFQAKALSAVYWFDAGREVPIQHRQDPTCYHTIGDWNVKSRFLEEELENSGSDAPDLPFCIQTLVNMANATQTVTPKDPSHLIHNPDEILANAQWRMLQLRNFVGPGHGLTGWGKALASAYASSNISDSFNESLLWIMELVRYNVLPQIIQSDDVDIMLVCLVVGALECNATCNPHFLHRLFALGNSCLQTLNGALRNLQEMVLLSMFVNVDATRLERTDWTQLSMSLPFLHTPSCGMSIAIHNFLSTSSEKTEELDKAFRFWDAVMTGIATAVDVRAFSKTQAAPFFHANEWLTSRRNNAM